MVFQKLTRHLYLSLVNRLTNAELEELVNQSDDSETGNNVEFEDISGSDSVESIDDPDIITDENDINKAFGLVWVIIWLVPGLSHILKYPKKARKTYFWFFAQAESHQELR